MNLLSCAVLVITLSIHRLAHALPAACPTGFYLSATCLSREPDTLLGKVYNVLHHDNALLDMAIHVQTLTGSWGGDDDRPLTRTIRFRRTRLGRTFPEVGEVTRNRRHHGDDLNLLPKQELPAPAVSPEELASSSTNAVSSTTTQSILHSTVIQEPSTAMHTATPENLVKEHKDKASRKHKGSVAGSHTQNYNMDQNIKKP